MNEELKNHILALSKAHTRLDGRKADEYRKPISVEYGVVCTAHGSARVKIGETQVIAGIKLEIGSPFPDKPDEGSIMIGAELLPLSNPEFELGPPGIQAVELARVVDRGIREAKAIDFKKLCITQGEKVWLVVIDICPINDEGNLLDASALATIAAIKDARFPEFDGERITEKMTDDRLPITCVPMSVTVLKIGNTFIVDPVSEEEKVLDGRLSVASLEDGTLCALQKGGNDGLTTDEIKQMIDIACTKGNELRKYL